MNRRMTSLLSLAMKAGKMVTGEQACELALRQKTACLVIVAADASENTRSKFVNKCFYYKKPVAVYGSKEELSRPIGKENRAVLALTDANFAARLQELMGASREIDENVESEPGKETLER